MEALISKSDVKVDKPDVPDTSNEAMVNPPSREIEFEVIVTPVPI